MALSMGFSGWLYENFGGQAYAGMALLATAGAICGIAVWRRHTA